MDPSGEGLSKEIPAQQQTVDAIASGLKGVMRRRFEQTFHVGEPDSRDTLQILNYPIAPWRRHRSDGLRLGREMHAILKEKDDVLNGDVMETVTKVTPFRLDTRRSKPPILLIDADGTDQYTEGNPGEYLRRVAARAHRPETDKWKTPTEEQAQKLRTIVDRLGKHDELEHMLASRTTTEAKGNEEFMKQVNSHFNRIFSASEDSVTDSINGAEIELSLNNKIVHLIRSKKDGIMLINISEPIENDDITNVATENYVLAGGLNVTHSTTFVRGTERQSTPQADADEEQKDYLMAVLETCTDEQIKAELAARKAFQGRVDHVLAVQGHQEEDHQEASIPREGFEIYVYKSTKQGEFVSPYTSVTIRNFVDEDGTENEDDIKEQAFELAGGHPLKVRTHRYGEETTEGTTTLATKDQTTYINTVLEEVA